MEKTYRPVPSLSGRNKLSSIGVLRNCSSLSSASLLYVQVNAFAKRCIFGVSTSKGLKKSSTVLGIDMAVEKRQNAALNLVQLTLYMRQTF
jgi:hypothetical protein